MAKTLLPNQKGVLRVTNSKPKPGYYDHKFGFVRVWRDGVKIAETTSTSFNPLKELRKHLRGKQAKSMAEQLKAAGCSELEIDFVLERKPYLEWLNSGRIRQKRLRLPLSDELTKG
ncbi:hypothetical protein [Photobacterium damselae]|uniref:hypothetical protein n=1 Tax=Photobacterium damselae TaxID=38293 RepID=UPI001F3446E0|nr:hypothetical protein [Photobacterium damselae]UKA12911.1 hypothetical protein IHC91_21575 [Photobacterium damselae subsp. damselae]